MSCQRILISFVAILSISLIGLATVSGSSAAQANGALIARGGDDGGPGGGSGDSGSSGGGSDGSSNNFGSGDHNSNFAPPPPPNVGGSLPLQRSGRDSSNDQKSNNQNPPKLGQEAENEIEEFQNIDGNLDIESSSAGKVNTKTNRIKLKIKDDEGTAEAELETEDGGFKLTSKGVGALTNFPIFMDPATHQLFVRTGNGLKAIRVLPDQAAAVATQSGIQNQVGKIQLIEASSSGTLNGTVVFNVEGRRNGTLLGFIPINVPVNTEISADSGQVVSTQEPFWLQLLSPLIK